MRKTIIFAAIAAVAFTACNKDVAPVSAQDQQEISINSIALTKGYVEGTDFTETAFDKLHDASAVQADRKLWMSAYLTPQSGTPGNYFVGQEFSKNANGESDNLWHHSPKVYWPIGAQGVDFLAYSALKPVSGTALNWNADNAASKLILDVSEDYLQDDILFGAVAGRQTNAGAPVAMTFKHAQAWIQFQIKVEDASMEDIVKIKDITISNLYTRGELTINGGATPSASWNFKKEIASDYAMADTFSILAPNYIKKDVGFMDMLVPEQAQTSFVMHYTLEGQDNALEYKYELGTATWEQGKKYIYEITIKPYEIVVEPTVTQFDVVNPGATGFPSVLE